MSLCIDTPQRIEAREILEIERLQMLPRHFGRHMITVEHAVYTFMRELSKEYTGGYWSYVELSNGGFYMAPIQETHLNVTVDTNGFLCSRKHKKPNVSPDYMLRWTPTRTDCRLEITLTHNIYLLL
jgi:hypothetical protein